MSRYPEKSNWISCEKDETTGNYWIENHILDTPEFEMTPEEMKFLNRLDGKADPIEILLKEYGFSTREAEEYLEYLDDQEVLRKGRGLRLGRFSFGYTVVKIKDSTKYRALAAGLYFLMAIGFFPMIYMGIQCFWKILQYDHIVGLDDSMVYMWIGLFGGVFVGVFLHEIGHAVAGIAFGARALEFGVGIRVFPMAYTMLDDSKLSSFSKRTLIMLAGPTVNLFIVGISLYCNLQTERFASLFAMCAFVNLQLFLINLLPVQGYDGMQALELLIGKNSLWVETLYIFDVWRKRRNSNRSRRAYSQNLKAGIVMAFMVCVTKLIFPILLLYDICIILNI